MGDEVSDISQCLLVEHRDLALAADDQSVFAHLSEGAVLMDGGDAHGVGKVLLRDGDPASVEH